MNPPQRPTPGGMVTVEITVNGHTMSITQALPHFLEQKALEKVYRECLYPEMLIALGAEIMKRTEPIVRFLPSALPPGIGSVLFSSQDSTMAPALGSDLTITARAQGRRVSPS